MHSLHKLAEHDVKRREERAHLLSRTGGSPGHYQYHIHCNATPPVQTNFYVLKPIVRNV